MTDVDPEKATIDDLFRLMTEMRGEMTDMRANVATRDGLSELRTEMNARLDEAAGEREAIRNVVDNDLASHDQMLRIEGDLVEVKKAQRQNGKKIDGLAERIDRASIPVR